MADFDRELGDKVHKHLEHLGIETPMSILGMNTPGKIVDVVTNGIVDMMNSLGLNLRDDSLKDTPRRVANMYAHELFNGLNYQLFPKATVVENKMKYDEMIVGDMITVQSMCEHHLVPFVGTATIAYIPKDKVLGLSKFNRIVDFFCRRPQIQERLTEQISATLRLILETEDVAVVIRAEHFCVKLRGVKDACSSTITSKLTGKFREVDALRSEFLALSREGKV